MALALATIFALAFLLIPAAQAAAGTLTVTIAGTGSGEVNSENGEFATIPFPGEPPIACSSPPPGGGECENEMTFTEAFGPPFEGVVVEAFPAPGSEFTGWTVEEGIDPTEEWCANPAEEKCFVGRFSAEEGNAKVTATFEPSGPPPSWTLTLKKEGTGEGWVVSTPAGINCGLACTTPRSAEFEEGTVTLHAYGREFAGWAACPGTATGRDCEVSLTEAKEAKATFTDKYSLTVEKEGTGNGWVLSTPAGINCGLACTTPRTAYFTEGTSVELYVYGSQFTGWTACPGAEGGTVNGKNRKCTISMTEDKVAKPNFTA